jgi:transcriptional regulator with XRE-family HTH domain
MIDGLQLEAKRGRKPYAETLRARVRELRGQDKGYEEIARELNVSKSWVGNVLQGYSKTPESVLGLQKAAEVEV